MRSTEKTEMQAFKTYIDKEYGYDVPETEVLEYRRRCISFIKQLIKIDIDKIQRKKIRKALAIRNKGSELILASRIEIPYIVDAPISGKETILIANQFGERLLSREASQPLKKRLQSNIKKNIYTKLNFKGVKSTDNAFVDEAISKVKFSAGEDHFKRKVSITYANKQVRESIEHVTNERKKFYIEMGGTT